MAGKQCGNSLKVSHNGLKWKGFGLTPLGDPVVMLVQDFFEALGFGGPDLKNTG